MEESMKGRTNQEWLDGVYDKLLVKMSAECARLGTMIPFAPRNGKYFDVENTPLGLHFWTNGFWSGMLWQMYHATGDESYRKAAEGVEERLAAILKSFDGVSSTWTPATSGRRRRRYRRSASMSIRLPAG